MLNQDSGAKQFSTRGYRALKYSSRSSISRGSNFSLNAGIVPLPFAITCRTASSECPEPFGEFRTKMVQLWFHPERAMADRARFSKHGGSSVTACLPGSATCKQGRDDNHQPSKESDGETYASPVFHEDTGVVAAREAGSIGSLRIRFPVAANTALATAGARGGTPVSPMPPGSPLLGTMCTSTSGASLIRRT